MLIFVLAGLLCCLYASDTIIISYCYRFYPHNPSSAKLLLLSEALKLFIASCLFLADKTKQHRQHDENQPLLSKDAEGLPVARPSETASASAADGQQREQRLSYKQSGCPRSRWKSWAIALLTFSVPSLCYFATNNLSFYALTLMSAHLYTLLCDLKIITTGLLNYLVLDKRLNQHAVLSLVVLFLGICVGQYSTMRADAGSLKAMAAASPHWLHGFLLMVAISIISAGASVYTEWVMNHSRFRHESLNLQNIRLYTIGIVLNALYYFQMGGKLKGFLDDMRGPHWAVVLILALMGLITGVLIKHYGNIVKVFASSIASLFAAWVSQVLLKDPPPVLFYAGVLLAMAATVQLQRARSSLSGSADGAAGRKQGSRSGQPHPQSGFKASALVPVALAVLVLVFVPQLVPWSRDWVNLGPHQKPSGASVGTAANRTLAKSLPASTQHIPANLNNPASLVPRGAIDAPMPVLPPFAPTCFVQFHNRTLLGCPVMNCSLDVTCTVHDKSCCTYYNMHMLDFFDRMLYSKGLQGEYLLVYGSALGAARNQTLLGQATHVDMALSPTALQVLEQNSTREQLWRQGYVFWHDRDTWRLCPHSKHPSHDFRAIMLGNVTHYEWEQQQQQQHKSAGYIDVHLMWPTAASTSACDVVSDYQQETAQLAVLLQPLSSNAVATAHDAHSEAGDLDSQQQYGDGGGLAAEDRRFCLQLSKLPVVVKASSRPAAVAGLAYPAPHNMEEHLEDTYGSGWQQANHNFQGPAVPMPDGLPVLQALLTRLSVTAWGDMPWAQRMQRCEDLSSDDNGEGVATDNSDNSSSGSSSDENRGIGQGKGGSGSSESSAVESDSSASSDSSNPAAITASNEADVDDDGDELQPPEAPAAAAAAAAATDTSTTDTSTTYTADAAAGDTAV